jgi:16S rRNA processing protein RimM
MVIMGRVASAFGIRGWVKIQPYSEHVDGLLDYRDWYLGKEQGPWRKVEVAHAEPQGKALAAQLCECTDRNAAEKLKGMLIAVPRSSLPAERDDEYYWADLIGLTAINRFGETLGVVAELIETGANDVLVVRKENREILIPFLKSVIGKVDLAARTIHVDWSADYLS